MPRNLPGKITREAPPGPEMTAEQFELAVEELTHDAARWRCLKRNWLNILELDAVPTFGGQLQAFVDDMRKRGE